MIKFPTIKFITSLTYYYVLGVIRKKIFRKAPIFIEKVKFFYLVFVLVLVPVYWIKYGPSNFLWFSDIALFFGGIGLWTRSRLMISMVAVGVLALEIVWNVDYFYQLISGRPLVSLTNYMFDKDLSLFLRSLSLFHVFLPLIVIYLLIRWGYNPKALFFQWGLAWIILPLTYLFTKPKDNINWVFGWGDKPQTVMPRKTYFTLVMLAFPLLVFIPSHFLLKRLF